jgi:hypothetical protein
MPSQCCALGFRDAPNKAELVEGFAVTDAHDFPPALRAAA